MNTSYFSLFSGSSAVALMFFFLAVLPLIYLASLFFTKPPLGFILLSFFNIITGIFTVLLVMILQIPVLGLQVSFLMRYKNYFAF